MIALFIVMLVIMYAGGVGYSYPRLKSLSEGRCKNCRKTASYSYCGADHEIGAFFAAVLWPMGWVVYGGSGLGHQHASGETRIERRQRKEIEGAKHRAELARIAADEAEHLNRQLRAAGKNELVR